MKLRQKIPPMLPDPEPVPTPKRNPQILHKSRLRKSLENIVAQGIKGWIIPGVATAAAYALERDVVTAYATSTAAAFVMMSCDGLQRKKFHPLATAGYSLYFCGGIIGTLITQYYR